MHKRCGPRHGCDLTASSFECHQQGYKATQRGRKSWDEDKIYKTGTKEDQNMPRRLRCRYEASTSKESL